MQQRAIATREKIVTAAAKIFSETSYAEAAMSDITRAAEVTQGSVYFHFTSKSDLAREIAERQHALSMHISKKRLEADQSPLEKVIALSHDIAESLMSDPLMQAGLRLSTESHHSLPSIPASSPYEDWISVSNDLLQAAVTEGELPEDTDTRATATAIIGAFTGLHTVGQALDGGEGAHERLDFLWNILLHGLVKNS
ncbi:TetR family transcriptional regulator [Acaricomes phytoseiuli]|uniref:ScbR family autoregulator-binding transcription factor n=1 Tax=Acaricomes phytoseiuli TaxID=291968 RepID=UPI000376B779|nr:ScbR family autoregulator-binding transcription factor [Acaricomes phytoseiuli]MCW1249918.1 TetR family transcriptional regulator [Acaricomes phytoseiuli]